MIYSTSASIFDSDAYGVDTDSPVAWWEEFSPKNHECYEAQNEYNIYKYEALDTIAGNFGLDTSEWSKDDFDTFMEIVGLV